MADPYDDEELAALTGAVPAAPGMVNPNRSISAPKAAPKAGGANALYELLLGQAPYGQKERMLLQQMQMAEELRGEKAPAMRSAGKLHFAANPLEFIGAGLKVGVGAKQRGDIEAKQEQLFNDRLAAVSKRPAVPMPRRPDEEMAE